MPLLRNVSSGDATVLIVAQRVGIWMRIKIVSWTKGKLSVEEPTTELMESSQDHVGSYSQLDSPSLTEGIEKGETDETKEQNSFVDGLEIYLALVTCPFLKNLSVVMSVEPFVLGGLRFY